MSGLHPGGFRGRLGESLNRVFNAAAISKLCKERRGNRNHRNVALSSIALANRWGGKPHKHEREIARRQRQKAATNRH